MKRLLIFFLALVPFFADAQYRYLSIPQSSNTPQSWRAILETDLPNIDWSKVYNTPTSYSGYGLSAPWLLASGGTLTGNNTISGSSLYSITLSGLTTFSSSSSGTQAITGGSSGTANSLLLNNGSFQLGNISTGWSIIGTSNLDLSYNGTPRLHIPTTSGVVQVPGGNGTLGFFDQLGGKALSSLVTSPGSGQNGYSLTWDNAGNQYTLTSVSGGGGGVSDGDKGDITVSSSGTVWSIDAGAVSYADIANGTGLSVLGRSANTSGVNADIAAGADFNILRRSGTSIGFGSIDLSQSGAVGTSRLPFANLAQVTARSILGVTGNATADVASIQGTTDQVLRVDGAGTGLSFGQVNLASSAAVTGVLKIPNGGTGSSTQNFVDLSTNQTSIAGQKTFTAKFQANWANPNDIAFGVNPSGTQGVANIQIMRGAHTMTFRNATGETMRVLQQSGTATTSNTNQIIYGIYQDGTVSAGHTGANYTGFFHNITKAGTQSASITDYAIVAQTGQMVMGAATPTGAAYLVDLQSTTQGFAPPRMTKTQRDAISSPGDGLLIYNTDSKSVDVYNGSSWNSATVQESTTTINTAAILTANATPVQLLAAPGAGKLIVITSPIVCKFKFGSAAFATNTDFKIYYGSGTSSFTATQSGLLTNTADAYRIVQQTDNGSLATTLENAGIFFKVDTGNPTSGTGSSLVISFTYRVISL